MDTLLADPSVELQSRNTRFEQVTIIGVGLIGGSIGLAVKQRSLAHRVIGFGHNTDSLEQALRRDCIDRYETVLPEAVRGSDLVIVCTPVNTIARVLMEAAQHCPRGTLLTDAGSTKCNIIEELNDHWPKDKTFVPAHPLAGSEKTGPEHANGSLFQDRLTILTPLPESNAEAVAQVEWFWRSLGSRTVRMTAEAHDRVLATTSHLPHAIAAALASVTPLEWLSYTAGGFRDTTRIAAADPELWAAIFQANREALLLAIENFQHRLFALKHILHDDNGKELIHWLSEAKRVRDALGS